MRKRPNPFEVLLYDGDWHTALIKSLVTAEEGTNSTALLKAIRHLKAALAEIDECAHTVSVSRPMPNDLNEEFVIECVKDTPHGEEVSVKASTARCITLTMTGRGSREGVEQHADRLLSRGIGMAEFVLHSRRR